MMPNGMLARENWEVGAILNQDMMDLYSGIEF
jgi:hypothetical protein